MIQPIRRIILKIVLILLIVESVLTRIHLNLLLLILEEMSISLPLIKKIFIHILFQKLQQESQFDLSLGAMIMIR